MCYLTRYQVKASILILLILLVLSCSSSNQQSSSPTTDLENNLVVSPQMGKKLPNEVPVDKKWVFSPQMEKSLSNEAALESIEIIMPEYFPVQVNVIARGSLPDDCTTIDQITEDKVGDTLRVKIITARQTGKVCTKVMKPFEGVIPLNVVGLSAGIYTVNVNSVVDIFELNRDNPIP